MILQVENGDWKNAFLLGKGNFSGAFAVKLCGGSTNFLPFKFATFPTFFSFFWMFSLCRMSTFFWGGRGEIQERKAPVSWRFGDGDVVKLLRLRRLITGGFPQQTLNL